MIVFLAIIGSVIAAYMIYAEHRKRHNKNYSALCDLSDRVSCSKVFMSKHSKTFGIANSRLGLGMYIIIIFVQVLGYNLFVQIISGLGVIMSIYLAHRLVQQKIVCIACILSYTTITAIFVLSLLSL